MPSFSWDEIDERMLKSASYCFVVNNLKHKVLHSCFICGKYLCKIRITAHRKSPSLPVAQIFYAHSEECVNMFLLRYSK